MSISAISSNAYWLTGNVKAAEKQGSTDAIATDSSATASVTSNSATKVAASTGQYIPISSAVLTAQEVGADVTGQLSDYATTTLPEGVTLLTFPPMADEEAMRSQLEEAANNEARKNNPFHDVELPPGSIGLSQEHLPNIDLGGKMLAVTFPEGTQRIDVAQTASQITQDADGSIRVPAGLKWQLISPLT